ncbi:hypothetical protein CH063_03815 [Colletotrichum higginsianum]|uniref:Uncharacterized protein n=1 Tax=Colletotrichum higginsianum (strain IMI 349063) TaxID=759273 RepID=H1W162_COLHI|nr:hypothetical protein CH63R_01823 [Colletotrichum higginsianum IMI 349063]OBR13097.1 hypothetical protein CH63R_01823 [Colletotrichum higginsianum IMI 349063]CCF46225.1 hypothetical protein CH063_03815 [Colletotrichum higginsianum]
MVVEVGSLNRSSLEPFKTWRLQGSAGENVRVIDVETDLLPSLAPRQCSEHADHCASTATCRHIPLPSSSCRHLAPHPSVPTPATVGEADASPTFRQPLPKLAEQYFAFSTDHDQSSFVFQRSSPLPRIEKRQRAESDVDGPYTAALSCKKRRLRLQLITSRLSQPFSLPATHIINREAIASGDKRFVKLAAVANSPDADRQGLIRETSIMLRAAVLNRVRLRVRNEAMLRGDLVVAVTAANAAVLHHGQQLATGARFVAQSSALAEQQQQTPPARVVLIRSGISSPNSIKSPPGSPKTPQSSRMLPKSPRLQPARSPVLAPSGTMLEEMEDDGILSFPTAEHDCSYAWADDDDLEDVYSDFGAIFGGPVQNGETEEDGHSYEEYLDELDGISWVGGR